MLYQANESYTVLWCYYNRSLWPVWTTYPVNLIDCGHLFIISGRFPAWWHWLECWNRTRHVWFTCGLITPLMSSSATACIAGDVNHRAADLCFGSRSFPAVIFLRICPTVMLVVLSQYRSPDDLVSVLFWSRSYGADVHFVTDDLVHISQQTENTHFFTAAYVTWAIRTTAPLYLVWHWHHRALQVTLCCLDHPPVL